MPTVVDAYRTHALNDQRYAAGESEQLVTFDDSLV